MIEVEGLKVKQMINAESGTRVIQFIHGEAEHDLSEVIDIYDVIAWALVKDVSGLPETWSVLPVVLTGERGYATVDPDILTSYWAVLASGQALPSVEEVARAQHAWMRNERLEQFIWSIGSDVDRSSRKASIERWERDNPIGEPRLLPWTV